MFETRQQNPLRVGSKRAAIRPYVKRHYVSHRHTTITSMHRTRYEIFGLPPLNLFDALPNDSSDCFTATPDLTPYAAVPVDKRLYDWPRARDPKDPDYRLARKTPTIERDAFDRPARRGRSRGDPAICAENRIRSTLPSRPSARPPLHSGVGHSGS